MVPFTVRLSILLCLVALAASSPAAAETYDIDSDHTEVRFTWDHLGLSRQGGRFTSVSGSVEFDPDMPAESKIDVSMPLKSLTTGIKKLDEHLLTTREFFDAGAHPAVTFTSTGVTMKSDRTADVAGELTINGITKPVVLDVLWNGTGPHPLGSINPIYSGKIVSGFTATTQIRRSDWGITRGAPFVSDELRISIETEMHRNATEADAGMAEVGPAPGPDSTEPADPGGSNDATGGSDPDAIPGANAAQE